MSEKTAAKKTPVRVTAKTYHATVNLEYPTADGKTVFVKAGETATGVPSSTIKAWVEQGILEEIK